MTGCESVLTRIEEEPVEQRLLIVRLGAQPSIVALEHDRSEPTPIQVYARLLIMGRTERYSMGPRSPGRSRRR